MTTSILPVKSPSPKPCVQFDSSPMNSSPSVDFFPSEILDFKSSLVVHPKRVVTPDWIKKEKKDVKKEDFSV